MMKFMVTYIGETIEAIGLTNGRQYQIIDESRDNYTLINDFGDEINVKKNECLLSKEDYERIYFMKSGSYKTAKKILDELIEGKSIAEIAVSLDRSLTFLGEQLEEYEKENS